VLACSAAVLLPTGLRGQHVLAAQLDPASFKLSASSFPPGSKMEASRVESNAAAQKSILIHWDSKTYADEGRLTGYFEKAWTNTTDAAGNNHGVFTAYLVSIYETSAQATAAYKAQLHGYRSAKSHPTHTMQTSRVKLSPDEIGSPSSEALWASILASNDGTTFDQNELFFVRGPVLVQVMQFAQSQDLTPYLTDALPYMLTMARALDDVVAQAE
jgi:hypothetical protein